MAHLGTLKFLSARREKTTEELFVEHVIGLLRRAHKLQKSHRKYVYFDSLAKREAPKFGLELVDGHWISVGSKQDE